jgi:hypothetical protein
MTVKPDAAPRRFTAVETFSAETVAFSWSVIPTRGQVGWELPKGLCTYWRGEIISLELTDR